MRGKFLGKTGMCNVRYLRIRGFVALSLEHLDSQQIVDPVGELFPPLQLAAAAVARTLYAAQKQL